MKPQARYEFLRAVLPALAGAVVTAAILWAEALALDHCVNEKRFWLQYIGAIPDLFWSSTGEDIPSILDGWIILPWALACAFFFTGPLVAFICSRGKAAHIFSSALLLGVITHGCVSVVSFCGFIMDWDVSTVTPAKLVQVWWPSFAWVFGLSLGGAAVGIGVQRIARAVAKKKTRRYAGLAP